MGLQFLYVLVTSRQFRYLQTFTDYPPPPHPHHSESPSLTFDAEDESTLVFGVRLDEGDERSCGAVVVGPVRHLQLPELRGEPGRRRWCHLLH